jgi:hypothetical protein
MEVAARHAVSNMKDLVFVLSDHCRSLADMAALGMTVISVIHQPRFSSFMLFDQVSSFSTGKVVCLQACIWILIAALQTKVNVQTFGH